MPAAGPDDDRRLTMSRQGIGEHPLVSGIDVENGNFRSSAEHEAECVGAAEFGKQFTAGLMAHAHVVTDRWPFAFAIYPHWKRDYAMLGIARLPLRKGSYVGSHVPTELQSKSIRRVPIMPRNAAMGFAKGSTRPTS
jgi:hypothetical protein